MRTFVSRTVFLILGCALAAGAQQTEEVAHLRLARDAFRDAVNSVRLIVDSSERDYAVSEIAKAQARSGFLPEAISTTTLKGKFQNVLVDEVATIVADRGEFEAAMKAVQGQNRFAQDAVREEIGMEQARRGDVRAALITADSMQDGYPKESVVYFACLELLRQGNRAEAERLQPRLKSPDHLLPKESDPAFDWRNPSPPTIFATRIEGSCRVPGILLQTGKIAEAVSCIEAEPNPADVASDLAKLAKKAADLGNLDAALKIADNPHLSGTRYEEMYLVGALGSIGRRWVTLDSGAALKWAETRPSEYQRAVALAGVAEGIATSGQPLH